MDADHPHKGVTFAGRNTVSAWIDGEWHAVPCIDIDMDGTDLKTWMAVAADLRRRYSAQEEVTEEVVLAALKAIRAIASDAEDRVGLTKLAPTIEELEAAEAETLNGPLMVDRRALRDGPDIYEDPFGPGIPTGTAATRDKSSEPAAAPDPAPTSTRPLRKWS